MLLTSWLRQLPGLMARRSVRGWKRKPVASRQARRGTAASSQIMARAESLENRALLSSITVTSLEDNTTADGQVTLREAIQAANTDSSVDGSTAGSGADTITFASSLFTGGNQTLTLSLFDTGLDSTEFGATAFIISTDIDTLRTAAGKDRAHGEDGNDRIESLSEDTISGGAGTNEFIGPHARIDEAFVFDFDRLLV